MTSRDVRLSISEQIVIIGLLISLPMLLFPVTADAQTQTKPRLVFEIKNFPMISIPDQTSIPQIPIIVESEVITAEPPIDPDLRIVGDKVYMDEPQIRAYVCPKLGNKCNIFVAILKAENGTHECTRDNKGLNKNGSIDVGLAQINWNSRYNPPYSIDQLRDCKFNLDIALKKVEARGFQPWVAYNKGLYKKHLKTASQTN
ncbi:MAG: hypothetical protein HY336_01705 [Candidatus Doudnabacteria bacterium]|nr:hypothetical protein [Candidatus Doudnabacteria bacterium]